MNLSFNYHGDVKIGVRSQMVKLDIKTCKIQCTVYWSFGMRHKTENVQAFQIICE